ncbi:MAG: hypothetical protein AB7O96_11220 [Pseudobdellovibrionaceae bacterium]
MNLLFLLCTVFVCACSSIPKFKDMDAENLLFPKGEYKHKAVVKLREKEGEENARPLNVNGILTLDDKELNLLGISAFGTAVFRYAENLETGEVSSQIFDSKLKKEEKSINTYFQALRRALILPGDGALKGYTEVLSSDGSGRPAIIKVLGSPTFRADYSSYGNDGIPEKVKLKGDFFEIRIEFSERPTVDIDAPN